ncbi:MAG: D-alanyl-D-alanine endopeptidase [Pseudomonadota bacterium]|jgi:D-alanyl-D-alanine endopeptidase (penicillin-binding protein 7)
MKTRTLRIMLRTVSTLAVVGLAGLAAWFSASPVDAFVPTGQPARPLRAPPGAPSAWRAPDWLPASPDLDALVYGMDARGPERGPSVSSRAAFVYDLDANRVLFERNADVVRPVASITKLVSALALVRDGGNLDSGFCVGAAQYPTRSGAPSHLSTGDCLQGWDALGAALVASDNRAAFGLAAVAGQDVDRFVEGMNQVSGELGMDRSSWTDPSGLEDENLSTARDIARATVAVAAHPTLSLVSTAPSWDIVRSNRPTPRRLFSTNRLVGRDGLEFLASKTGYTDTARYCFTSVFRTARGQRLVVTLLGAEGKLTRWADMDRILAWVDAQAAG